MVSEAFNSMQLESHEAIEVVTRKKKSLGEVTSCKIL